MTISTFAQLPDTARLWAFGATTHIDDAQESALRTRLASFLEEWTAHGAALAAGLEVVEGRFLLVAVDEGTTRASGCSIDALVHRLQALEAELGLGLVDSSPIWYRRGDEIERVTRAEFLELASRGEVTGDTTVFDLTLSSVGEARAGGLETPASESWHARLLRTAGADLPDRSAS